MADHLSSPPKYATLYPTSVQGHKLRNNIINRRPKVLRACDRCRLKKTKCDAGFPPCRRCQRDGFVCTTRYSAKNDYGQLPPGYTEVYKKSHSVLEATVKKLYLMVRNGDTWDFDEPELDNNGELVVHDIVHKLGYTQQRTESRPPTPPMVLNDEAESQDTSSQHKKEVKEHTLTEEAVVPETELFTPCQAEQLPLEQCLDKFTDASKVAIDGYVGNENLNTSPQHWVNGFYMDLPQQIWGADMMGLNWPQSDVKSEACGGAASVNKVQLFQPLALDMQVEDSKIRWF
ncbi:hypothetical protein FGADI_658 [Fusarium gaditjirri]|uniref:Zn(2)-C6 fungal-type domain-containing protein n=1 Tax=Fusarium gaditjirri TaxID=282569 RepID=A0A8H4TMW5_9HYPO|nr:hypothetical protein FGADI_658 [Fusarium gaditjirri]